MLLLILTTSASVRSLTRISGFTLISFNILFDKALPMPNIRVSPISTRSFLGRSTPAILAMLYSFIVHLLLECYRVQQTLPLSLPLLVPRVFTEDPDYAFSLYYLTF